MFDFRRIVLALCVLACIIPLAKAQREDTVYSLLWDNLTTVPATSALIENIGQSAHKLVVVASNNGGLTCTSPQTVSIFFEYSYDNVTYVRAENPITRLTANEDNVIVGTSAIAAPYPYLRVRVDDFNNTNCQLTVNYSGAIAPFNTNNVTVDNTFLGIAAIGNLANPSNLNIQYTPSVPVVTDINVSNYQTFVQTYYDAFDAGPWIKNDTVQATITSNADNTVNCATWTGGEYTDIGDARFQAGLANTGFTGTFPTFTVECNYIANGNKGTFATFVTANNNLVDMTYNGGTDAYTFTARLGAGNDGFRGNSLRITGVETVRLVPTSLNPLAYNHFVSGTTTWTTQTTPQNLKGCVTFDTDTNTANVSTVNINYKRNTCTSAMAESMTLRVDSGNAVRVYVDDYQAFSFSPSAGGGGALDFLIWGYGVPYIPAFVNAITEFEWGFMGGKNNTTGKFSWRNTVQPLNNGTNGYGATVGFNGSTFAQDELWIFAGNPIGAVWANSSGNILLDAIVKFDNGGTAGANTLIGQLWNAVYYNVNQPADTPYIFDGFNWRTFTHSSATGTLLFRYP